MNAIELIIFDCDGVLIDSETVASGLIARELTALGWEMTTGQAMGRFLGMSITDMEPIIEAELGRPLPYGWRHRIAAALLEELSTGVQPISGAREMLERVNAMGMRWRVASNSSAEELVVKFACTGLTALVGDRAISAGEVVAAGGRAKPAPDVFLAAAAAAGVAAEHCLVLEDSALGVTGAVAAGMTCYGYAPHNAGAHLLAAGASKIIHHLNDLFGALP